jgi:hypothetical protein
MRGMRGAAAIMPAFGVDAAMKKADSSEMILLPG